MIEGRAVSRRAGWDLGCPSKATIRQGKSASSFRVGARPRWESSASKAQVPLAGPQGRSPDELDFKVQPWCHDILGRQERMPWPESLGTVNRGHSQ